MIGIGVQAILRFCLNSLSCCNVGITDVFYEVFHWGGLRWHDIPTKFPEDWFMHSSNIKIITTEIWEAANVGKINVDCLITVKL
jgi:hypothetical protein